MKEKNGFGKKGWLLIIYCMAAFYVTTAFKDSMNVAVYTFENVYGWSQTVLLSLASVGTYASCIAIYITGALIAVGKIKIRRVMLITGIINAVTLSLWGIIPSLPIFILNYVVMCVAYKLWTEVANNTMAANWFPKKSGLVMGWTTMGYPIAAATCSMLYNGLASKIEFRYVYIIYGVISLIVAVWGYIGFREFPEDMGCYPDNDVNMTREDVEKMKQEQELQDKNSIWTAKKMVSVKESWLISIATGVLFMIAGGSMTQMVVRFITGGMEMGLAIKMMLIVGLCAIFGSWAVGKLDYRFGVKKAYIIAILFMAAAYVLVSVSSIPTMMIGGAIIGVGVGASSNFSVSFTSHYWGRENFKKAYGTILTIVTLVGAIGPLLIANLANLSSYTVAYLILFAICIVAMICVIPLKEGFVKRYEEKMNQ